MNFHQFCAYYHGKMHVMPPGRHAFRYFELIAFTTVFYTFQSSFWVPKTIKKANRKQTISKFTLLLDFDPILSLSDPKFL